MYEVIWGLVLRQSKHEEQVQCIFITFSLSSASLAVASCVVKLLFKTLNS